MEKNYEIAMCIPTIGRDDLDEVIEKIVEYVRVPTLIVIADDSEEKDIKKSDYEGVLTEKFDMKVLQTVGSWTGAGNARAVAVGWVLEKTEIPYIFNSDDNAIIENEKTVGNILTTLKQCDKVGYCGSIGNYTIYYHDFDEYSAKFFTNIGAFYGIKREALLDTGNFDPNCDCREDAELGLRMWKNGWWVLAVWAPIDHKRADIFENGGELWMECTEYVGRKHEDCAYSTSNGQIRRKGNKLPFPDVEIGFDENMNFYVKEKEDNE